jgi:alpha-beta hydrolase superfamily lysophospholipase
MLQEYYKIGLLSSYISDTTLVLQAENDHYADGRAQDAFCAGLAQSEKLVFPDAYHDILLENDSIRESALAAIRGFLQRNLR